MKYEGMLVSSLKINSTKNIVVSRELKTYDEDELDKYKMKFNDYKSEGVIEANSFESNQWELISIEDGITNKRNIRFEFETNKNINTIMKCYSINLLTNKLGINEIAYRVKVNNEALFITNYFNNKAYEEYEEFILNKSVNEILRYRDINRELFSFLNFQIPDDYYDFLENLNIRAEKNTRVLPDYKSILYFDYIVNSILENEKSQKVYKFFPVLLWWKVTSIIPIRPIEFLRLRKDCFFEEKGKYYLRVKRRKPNSFVERALENTRIQVFRVNKSLYNLAKEYTSKNEHKSDYFICRNFYNSFESNYVRKLKSGNIAFPHYYFDLLLKRFYDEVIKKDFSIENIHKKDILDNDKRFIDSNIANKIVRLQLGDSRHLAIINLILQGTNSYLIKEMAGHRDINSHLHYSRHAKEYISSKVIVLTDILKFELKGMEQEYDVKFSVGNKRYEKSISQNNNNLMKIGNYFCKKYVERENLFPYLCTFQCNGCNYSILDVDKVDKKEIDNKIIKCKSEMEKNLDILIKYIDEADIKCVLDKSRGKYFRASQQNIKETANRLNYLIYEEAQLQHYRFQKNIIDFEDRNDE